MKLILISFFVCLSTLSWSQQVEKLADATLGVGSYRGTLSLSYLNNWRVGSNQKIGLGVGGRFTGFVATDLYYITAPAKLTSGSTGPLVIFKENIPANIDSLLINTAQLNAFNVMVNIDYQLSKKIIAGFNIDVIGFSIGGSKRGNYINGVTGKNTDAKPTPFNVLLISDNDRGSLNSEAYLRYFINDKWAAKLGAEFLFTEYTTETNVQQLPEANDRFRNKSLMLCLGVTYKL